MAWEKASDTAQASVFRQLLPLIVTVVFLAGIAWVLWQVWVSVGKIHTQAKQQMCARNVTFTREGVTVGVKHLGDEKYVDATQSWVVKAWNLGSSASGSGGAKLDKAKRK